MTLDLYAVFHRHWNAGVRRDVLDGDVLLMGDARSPAQVQLQRGADVDTFYVHLPGSTSIVACWVSPTSCGLVQRGQPTDQPIPSAAVDVLTHALPMPKLDSLYGYTRDGRVVALSYCWTTDTDVVGIAEFVLLDHAAPDLWRGSDRHGDPRHVDLRKWWAAVDRGDLVIVDRDVATSTQPVEMRKHAGTYNFILARGPERWTGVDGPALYLRTTAHWISITEAQRLHGTDIRPGLTRL